MARFSTAQRKTARSEMTQYRDVLTGSRGKSRRSRRRFLFKQTQSQLSLGSQSDQCRINNGANGAAAPGPPQLGAPHKGFFLHTKQILYTLLPKCVLFRTPLVGLQRPPDPQLYCTLPLAALVWDTGAPILREKSPPLKFCTRPPTLVIRH